MNRIGLAPQSSTPFGREQIRDLPAVRVIPYEYVADFTTGGNPGNLVQDVINVSVEGVFVAVSIGYGLVRSALRRSLDHWPRPARPSASSTLGDVTLANIPPDILIEGFRINPSLSAARCAPNGQFERAIAGRRRERDRFNG